MVIATNPLGEVLDARTTAGDLCERPPRNEVRCYACGHRCLLREGRRGICQVRFNREGTLHVPGGYVAAFNATPQRRSPSFACCLVQDPYLWVGPQVLSL